MSILSLLINLMFEIHLWLDHFRSLHHDHVFAFCRSYDLERKPPAFHVVAMVIIDI